METLFFLASKLIWPFVSPGTFLILIPLVAYLFKRFGCLTTAAILWLIEICLVLIVGFYPVGKWLAKPLEEYSAAPSTEVNPDGIIVLGGAWLPELSNYWHSIELNQAAERDISLVILARKYPEAKLLFTGGSGRLFQQNLKEASVASQMYSDLGIDAGRLIFESQSRNTYENALFSKTLVDLNTTPHWLLITSAYHMPRAVGVFCQQGWQVQPYPVDHFYMKTSLRPYWAFSEHLWELERVSHEWLGLLVYRFSGKSSELFPRPCGLASENLDN